jgi:hypothetical protein
MYNQNYKIEERIKGRLFVVTEMYEGEKVHHGKFQRKEEAEDFIRYVEEARSVFRGDYAG